MVELEALGESLVAPLMNREWRRRRPLSADVRASRRAASGLAAAKAAWVRVVPGVWRTPPPCSGRSARRTVAGFDSRRAASAATDEDEGGSRAACRATSEGRRAPTQKASRACTRGLRTCSKVPVRRRTSGVVRVDVFSEGDRVKDTDTPEKTTRRTRRPVSALARRRRRAWTRPVRRVEVTRASGAVCYYPTPTAKGRPVATPRATTRQASSRDARVGELRPPRSASLRASATARGARALSHARRRRRGCAQALETWDERLRARSLRASDMISACAGRPFLAKSFCCRRTRSVVASLDR